MQGWHRDLGLQTVPDVTPVGEPLLEVRQAIEIERRVQTRAHRARIDAVRCLDPEQGLWQLDVALSREPGRLRDWRGALVWCDLVHGGAPWAGEVLDADERVSSLVVQVDPSEEPHPGAADVRPFDFLRAPFALVSGPAFAGARTAYVDLLHAAMGAATGRGGVRGGVPPAWTWSWATVWGPPGTGKTHTLAEVVAELAGRPGERVLVVSTTHRATDEAAIRIGQRAELGRVLRVGAGDTREYQARGLTHLLPPPRERVEALQAAMTGLDEARTPLDRARARRRVAALRRGLPTLASVLGDEGPACVVATVHAALSAVVSTEHLPFLDGDRAPFTTVVLDEAGLIPRATVAAVALLAARQVVQVGDPRQLSPICVASRSLEPRVKRWLAVSGLEHVRRDDEHVQSLEVQHRMHPEVRRVVSDLQYEGRLRDAPGIADRTWPGGGRLARLPRAVWLVLDRFPGATTADAAPERGAQRSWQRRATVASVRAMFAAYPELRRARGLFVSPYRAQSEAIGRLFAGLDAPTWQSSTIHAQQGAEAEVVLFDPVRFGGWPVPEWKRLINVALSRAQRMVFVFATRAELGQRWLEPLRRGLARFTVGDGGQLRSLPPEDAQGGLFVPPIGRPAGGATPGDEAAEPERPFGQDGRSTRGRGPDDACLGVQIAWQRASRRSLTRSQAQLVRRDLKDLGPRLVRGVAGSGKTIVLARWAAAELRTYPERNAAVLYGNSALRPHLQDLLEQAWRVTTDRAAGFPHERVELLHVSTFLQDLMAEARLPPPADRYDLDAHVRALRTAGPFAPRFSLAYFDEAQDLGHDVLGFLLGFVERDADSFPARIFYDNAQNVYGRSTPTWSEFGLDVRGRAAVLRESFRATRQGMELALNVLDQLRPLQDDPDLRDLIRPRQGEPLLVQEEDGWWRADFCVVRGQPPEVALYDTAEEELAGLVEAVTAWLEDGVRLRDVRVLALSRRLGEQAAALLRSAGVPARFAAKNDLSAREDAVVVTTPHSFKGYEAELVAVLGLDRFAPGGGGPLAAALYVAMTRARTWMRVSAVRVPVGHPGRQIVDALSRAADLQAVRPEAST